jgi:ABC-type transport system involved in cytochrome c biogenesis permease subunit
MDEALLLRCALAGYAGGYASSLLGHRWRAAARLTASLLALALALHTLALAARWVAHGHGPFTTMHEVLSSNLWSLALVLLLAAAVWREVRAAAAVAVPVLAVLALWALQADNGRGHFLPTYATPLLYVHAVLGKCFLGALLVAAALSVAPLLRMHPGWRLPLAALPDTGRCGELAYRFAAIAFVFDSLMLVAGAAWAQDAWGRYWAWDPLETWSFATWLMLAAALHARSTGLMSPRRQALWFAGAFVLAFVTFFGVPFVSTSPHKGAL